MPNPQPILDLSFFQDVLKDERLDGLTPLYSDSPASAVFRDIIRNRALAVSPNVFRDAVPSDHFVLGKGAPQEKYHTRVNGLPYRPAHAAWPSNSRGNPMVFLAQIFFGDSHDLVGETPGDVLLIFITTDSSPMREEPYLYLADENDCLTFEWQEATIPESALATQADIPRNEIVFPHCYGVRHRSFDVHDSTEVIQSLADSIDPGCLASNAFRRLLEFRMICCSCGMKVGGLPYWAYPPPDTTGQKFLGSFSGVNPLWDVAYPWTNSREIISLEKSGLPGDYLLFADGCVVNFFLDSAGHTNWFVQFL